MRKKALCAFFLLSLTSCAKTCPIWNYQQITTTYPSFNSASIVYSPPSLSNGLQVALTRNASGMQMHLNAHSLPILPHPEVPNRVLVHITIDGVYQEELAFLLQGGQRLLLTQKTCEAIIESLLCNKTIELKVSRYKSILVPADFQLAYNKLCKM